MQEIRIKHYWDAIDEESNDRDNAKWDNRIYTPFHFDNGDTKKAITGIKSPDRWSQSQKQRAKILFAQYLDINKVSNLIHDLRLIFSKTKDKTVAYTKLTHSYNKVTDSGFRSFNSISAIIHIH